LKAVNEKMYLYSIVCNAFLNKPSHLVEIKAGDIAIRPFCSTKYLSWTEPSENNTKPVIFIYHPFYFI